MKRRRITTQRQKLLPGRTEDHKTLFMDYSVVICDREMTVTPDIVSLNFGPRSPDPLTDSFDSIHLRYLKIYRQSFVNRSTCKVVVSVTFFVSLLGHCKYI